MATDEFGERARREIRRQKRRINKRNAQRAADDAAATTDAPQQTNSNLSQQVQWGNSSQFDNDGNPILRHSTTSSWDKTFDH
ncbi:hypothetical protein UFOVP111_127 [uncultured Caudovirales phage]|uniref:Uncharacterized protein n=1 Tax=uncultured Caudovirales phage TaxID=2100421 RepID=A0A6J5L2N6_9CAUD|nr:hypothetical protein UFOVP111_127 [uncultured Caudovirales phage]